LSNSRNSDNPAAIIAGVISISSSGGRSALPLLQWWADCACNQILGSQFATRERSPLIADHDGEPNPDPTAGLRAPNFDRSSTVRILKSLSTHRNPRSKSGLALHFG